MRRVQAANPAPLVSRKPNLTREPDTAIVSGMMTKAQALALMNAKTQRELADALGISRAAVSLWSDPLPESVELRILGTMMKRAMRVMSEQPPA